MKIVAVIPVKEISERVKSKNYRNFYKKNSLLGILIKKLKKCKDISKIYISSNSKIVEKISKKNNCHYLSRDIKFCNNVTPWSEVIYEVANSIPENDHTILMWCHTTTPLFDSYSKAIKIYKSKKFKNDGLISVEKFKKFLVTENKIPLNYSWGVWHPYSQNLENLYSITGALFMMSIKQFKKNRYVISKNPFYLESQKFEGLDIDTIDDFKTAQFIYKNKNKI
jgi:CMP-N-acetylneuraminic acid synthetase